MKTNLLFSLFAFVCISLAMSSCASDNAKTAETDAPTEVKTVTPSPQTPSSATNATAEVPTGPTTTMEFEEYEFDFGEINSGDKVQHVYKFTNTGDEPLVISNAKGTCGCTVPNWPKEPIAPGGKGEILVEFKSKGKSGAQQKRVIITANTNPATTNLTIKGQVNKIEEPAVSNG